MPINSGSTPSCTIWVKTLGIRNAACGMSRASFMLSVRSDSGSKPLQRKIDSTRARSFFTTLSWKSIVLRVDIELTLLGFGKVARDRVNAGSLE